jgi:hypothetical protein
VRYDGSLALTPCNPAQRTSFMAVHRRDDQSYADGQDDLPEVIRQYGADGYPAEYFADAVCSCGCRTFEVALDETAGAAVRVCTQCEAEHSVGDSEEYPEDAELEFCECLCDALAFEITVGVALCPDSEGVRWFYLACRCPACGLAGCYADWKNEHLDYRELLENV